ncbi:MAG: dethiobiotin synthase [Labilithrix sp.]|nr:dethiobiotin synthase [Labilithrix sp.]
MSPLLVVSGTGTEIGKTHLAAALIAAWAALLRESNRGAAVAGLKPIESGGCADGDTLGRMSTFHVKRFSAPYMLARPVSPHLAARDEGRSIEIGEVAAHVDAVRVEADAVVVELPGGLFSPLAESVSNADLARALSPTATLLVAPDRLGVLHDVGACARAAASIGLALHGIALVTPAHADASTGTNAGELSFVTTVPALATIPRAPIDDLGAIARTILRGLGLG